MTVRELLRYELWSEETSRRILGRIWKFLKPTAVVLGVLLFLLWIVFLVERNWLTSGERNAGRAALARIEGLQGLIDCNRDQFAAADQDAEAAVHLAMQKARTIRDNSVAFNLWMYLNEVESDDSRDRMEALIKSFELQ
ncbi:MAG: hypothetical protein WBX18_15475 [Terracidiphilus sp.]